MRFGKSPQQLLAGPDPGAGYQPASAPAEDRAGRHYRLVFFGTFLMVLLIGLLFTWLRPPIYQTKALLQVSYAIDNGGAENFNSGNSAFVLEQLVIHEQRLSSRRMMADVAGQIHQQTAQPVDSDRLTEILAVRPLPDSRLLELVATGLQPALLMEALNNWIDLYLAQFQDTQQSENAAERETIRQQLATLEASIADKRQELERFKVDYQIVSAERDENRAISKVKALGTALDDVNEEKARVAAELRAIHNAIAAGKQVVRPQDQRRLDNLISRATELEEEMEAYASAYTPRYMALDSNIQATQRNLELLKAKISETEAQSRTLYLEETERKLAAAHTKERELEQQLNEFRGQVQQFSSNLDRFNTLKLELSELERRGQDLKTRLVNLQVNEPFETRVDVLERPLAAGKPIAPPYWRDTGISLGAALLFAIVALFIYKELNPRQRPELVFNAHPVVREIRDIPQGLPASPSNPALDHDPLTRLPHQQAAVLTPEACVQLLAVTNQRTGPAVMLLLSGVSCEELLNLSWEHIDLDGAMIQLNRPIRLTSATVAALRALAQHQPSTGGLLLQTGKGLALNQETLDTWVSCAAIDAGLPGSEHIDARLVQHIYRMFLLQQGLRLGELEHCVGELAPEELNYYQQFVVPGVSKTIGDIETTFPVLRGSPGTIDPI